MRRIRAVLVAGSILIGAVSPPAIAAARAAPTITVEASRSSSGSNAGLLKHRTSGHRAVWSSSGRPLGVVLTTRFARATSVDGMRIQGAGVATRIRDARIEFSDGSALMTTTSARGSRSISFPARSVRWVRMVVVGVPKGRSRVALAGWWLHRGSSSRDARAPGDIARVASWTTSSGTAASSGWSAADTTGRQWVRAEWPRPMEVSAVRLFGGGTSVSSIRTGYLEFSDGSRVIVGTLEPKGGAPTTIAFTPRIARAVRFVVTRTTGGGAARLARLAVWTVGALPPRLAVGTPTYTSAAPGARSCAGATGAATKQLVLLCPSNGSRVGGKAHLVLSGPVGAVVSVSAAVPGRSARTRRVASSTLSSKGTGRVTIPMGRLVHGPTAVRITASGVAAPLYVQLENTVGVVEKEPAERYTRGLDLKFREDFTTPLSTTRDGAGAAYASGKPNSWGVDDFGDAIFAQPTGAQQNLGTGGGFLRIRSRALPPGTADPGGFGRTSIGGLISSAHLGGSGFSAQYGYFEARMLGPAGEGTWPAFWLLSTGSQSSPGASAGEIDAMEAYGHDPSGVCQTTHSYVGGKDVRGAAFCEPLAAGGDFALAWHTYGVRVTPTGTTFLVDGKVTHRTGAVIDADQPFFFLADLALGGGWPVDLTATSSQTTLYIDRISVWV